MTSQIDDLEFKHTQEQQKLIQKGHDLELKVEQLTLEKKKTELMLE